MTYKGTDSPNQANWDAKLFTFNLLVSSLFLFNTKENLNEETFRKLKLMTHLTKQIILDSKEGPNCIILVRDFFLEPELTPEQDIERFLKEEYTNDQDSVEVEGRNAIRKNMKKFFKSVESFRMAFPVFSKIKLKNLANLEFKDLDEDFRNDFSNLIKKIKLTIKPKSTINKNFNGPMLANFIRLIVDLINQSNHEINLYEIMSNIAQIEKKRKEDEVLAKELYEYRFLI